MMGFSPCHSQSYKKPDVFRRLFNPHPSFNLQISWLKPLPPN